MRLVALAATVALLGALAIPAAFAGTPTLNGTDGPGFTITLKKAGKKVSKLKAGHIHLQDQRQVQHPQLPSDRPRRRQEDVGRRKGNIDVEAEAEEGDLQVRVRPAQVVHEGLVHRHLGV